MLVFEGRVVDAETIPLAKTNRPPPVTLTLRSAAKPENLLLNPRAEAELYGWQSWGNASIEEVDDNPCFVVRNKGYLTQDIELPEDASGKYALLYGYVCSERVNSNGSLTGLPYLYGYMMISPRGSILSYLQGQKMLSRSSRADEWVPAYGIFKVPPETRVMRFFLKQAERKGDPQNGSAACARRD